MTHIETIKLLSKLTGSARISRRSRQLLRDSRSQESENWFMHVPAPFDSALDIKFEASGANEGWTQAGCFSFKKSDTLYDTPLAYKEWGEALKVIKFCFVVTSALASGVGDENKRYPGSVTFQVYLPNANRSKLENAFDHTMSQDDFVKMLIEGPVGDFKEALENA